MATSLAIPKTTDLIGASAGRERVLAGMLGLAGRVMRAGAVPVPAGSAAALRIIFGVIGLIAVIRFAANGWISELYIQPAHHFSYYGFGWVQAWPGWGMYLHFALLGLASLGVALGYRYRLSIIAFFLLFTYVELIDRTTYLNHYYLVSLLAFLMIFLPLGRAASLDARRGPKEESATIPRAALWLLRAQLGLVYVFAGLAKLNPDWLFHAQPLRIWLYNAADIPLIGTFLSEPWAAYAMSWGGAAFDLTIVGFLLWKRSRPFAYAVLVVFHLATWLLFPAIGLFPLIMMGAALIFFEPDWPLRLARWLRRQSPASQPSPAAPQVAPRPLPWAVRAAVILGAAFLIVQVVLPLRHLAYPGNVRWNEEGYRFSWRVLVTEKVGLAQFRVTGAATGEERLVYPEEYLTPTQVECMAYQPDMILDTAHLIRDDFTVTGVAPPEVRADVFVSYNSRPAVRLVDPDADLARIHHGPSPKRWLLPSP